MKGNEAAIQAADISPSAFPMNDAEPGAMAEDAGFKLRHGDQATDWTGVLVS